MDNTEQLQNQINNLQTQLNVLLSKGNQFNDARPNLFDIFGTFPTVTQAPTVVPSTPYDQLQIAVISGTWYLYIYDTAGALWKRVVIS